MATAEYNGNGKPAHAGIELTRKGQGYMLAHTALQGCPPGIEARQWRRAIAARVNEYLDVVEGLIEALDGALPDPDMEDTGDDEPSLGGQCVYAHGALLEDCELDPVDHEETGDNEPSLGSLEEHPDVVGSGWGNRSPDGSQVRWAGGNRDDREDDGDDKEPTEDSEPADPDAEDITWGGGSDERPLIDQQEPYRGLGVTL